MPAGNERLGFGSEAATTMVEPDGTFTFLNVPEGNYTVLAQASVMDFTTGGSSTRLADAPGFPGGGIAVGSMSGVPDLSFLTRSGQPSPLWGRASVSVSARNLDDVVVTLRQTVAIRGRIAFAEGTPTPGPSTHFVITAQPANGNPSLGKPSGFSGEQFSFTVEGLMTGSYLLSSLTGGFTMVSVTSNGRNVTDSGFDASGRDFDDVVVTLTDKKTVINGKSGTPGA